MSADDVSFDALTAWLGRNGFPLERNPLWLEAFPGGRGMACTRDIQPGDLILDIPKRFVIDSNSLQKHWHPASTMTGGKHLNAHQRLTLFLLVEHRKQNSPWRTYMQTLPRTFTTALYHCKEEEVGTEPQLLNMYQRILPRNACQDLDHQYAKMRHDFAQIRDALPQDMSLQWRQFAWAWWNVNTRSVCVQTTHDPSDRNVALVPFFDMLNHASDTAAVPVYNRNTQSLQIHATKAHRKGDQFFINYGAHDNWTLFSEYGFVLPVNPFDFIQMDADVNQMLHCSNSQREMEELLDAHGDFVLDAQGEPSWRLWLVLFLLAATRVAPIVDPQLVDQWKQVVNGRAERISMENERNARLLLRKLCRNRWVDAQRRKKLLDCSKESDKSWMLRRLLDTEVLILERGLQSCLPP